MEIKVLSAIGACKKLVLSFGCTLMGLLWVPLLWESAYSGCDSESLNGFVVCRDGE